MAELYSKNQLINPSAETGDLTGWNVVGGGVSVVSGGTEGDYCFRLNSTLLVSGRIEQTKSVTATPPDCKVSCDFLPSYDLPSGSTEVAGELVIEYHYGDGTKDETIIPCRDDTEGGV